MLCKSFAISQEPNGYCRYGVEPLNTCNMFTMFPVCGQVGGLASETIVERVSG